MKIVVDTGAWSEFFRRERAASAIAQEVIRLVRADVIQMLGPIQQELIFGARPDERFAQLREYLASFQICRSMNGTMNWRGSSTTFVGGTVFRGRTDLLICAAAARHKMGIPWNMVKPWNSGLHALIPFTGCWFIKV